MYTHIVPARFLVYLIEIFCDSRCVKVPHCGITCFSYSVHTSREYSEVVVLLVFRILFILLANTQRLFVHTVLNPVVKRNLIVIR